MNAKATPGLRARFLAWVDGPLGDLNPEEQELARTQQLGAIIVFTLTVVWVPILFAIGEHLLGAVVLSSLLLPLAAAWFWSRGGRPKAAGRVMMTSLSLGLLFTIAKLGGVSQAGAAWIVMIPMSALLYLPMEESRHWTLAAALGVGVLWVVEPLGWIPPDPLGPEASRLLDLFSLLMLVGSMAAGLSVRRRAWKRVHTALQRTNETLQTEIQVRQKAEEEARDAVAARTGFLATISHEIRTPLNGVLGITEVLLDTPLDEDQRELAETVKSSGRLLRTLLDDVLDYTKIDSGRVDLERLSVSPRALLSSVAESWGKLATEKGLELGVEIAPGVPDWIFGDPVRLQQVLNNLLSNALKFTASGHILLQVDRVDERLEFRVQDSGVGMSEAASQRIFEAFRQADSSVTRNFGGTGLGLAISRSLARAMGGDLWVDSTLGVGSLFTLSIPMELAEAPSIAEQELLEVMDLSGVRILVAEDNAVNQVVVSRLLERLGIEVTVAGDGQACLDAWDGARPDLVLMDCQMPGMDGYQAAERLRQRGVRTPIIALTANNMPGDRVRSLQAGMDDHLGKPIQPAALSACLQRWLRPSA